MVAETTRTPTSTSLVNGAVGSSTMRSVSAVSLTEARGPSKPGCNSGTAPPSKASTPSTKTRVAERSTPSGPVSSTSSAIGQSRGTPVSAGPGSRFTSRSRSTVTMAATVSA